MANPGLGATLLVQDGGTIAMFQLAKQRLGGTYINNQLQPLLLQDLGIYLGITGKPWWEVIRVCAE